MKSTQARLPLALLCASLIAASGCARSDPPPAASQSDGDAPRTALGRTVDTALREAREKLATENIAIDGDMHIRVGDGGVTRRQPRDERGNRLPKAEISPAGDLLIAGQPVEVDAAQRALLLQYRGQIVAVIESGMTIGVKGADLGMEAAGEALRGIFGGEGTKDLDKRVNARAEAIEAEALRLCEQLPAMYDTQQRLAAALPAFRPYATMTREDIEDCRNKKIGAGDAVRAEIRSEIRDGIRESIRGTVQATRDAVGMEDAAAEAEAASAEPSTQ